MSNDTEPSSAESRAAFNSLKQEQQKLQLKQEVQGKTMVEIQKAQREHSTTLNKVMTSYKLVQMSQDRQLELLSSVKSTTESISNRMHEGDKKFVSYDGRMKTLEAKKEQDEKFSRDIKAAVMKWAVVIALLALGQYAYNLRS